MNFGEVKSAVADWMDREDLSAKIPTFVQIVQLQLERANNFKYMEYQYSWADVVDVTAIAVPSDYKELISLRVSLSGIRYPLTKTTVLDAWARYPADTATGIPKLAALRDGGTNFLLRPTPDQSCTIEMDYFRYSATLLNDNDTNWLTEKAFDVLIYGALLEASPYLVDIEHKGLWQEKYVSALSSISLSEKRERIAGSYQRVQPLPQENRMIV